MLKKLFYPCFILLSFNVQIHQSYSQFLTGNDGFEGTRGVNTQPPYWSNCGQYSTMDTQPGQYGHNQYPAEGSSYLSLITREVVHPGTFETATADLLIPFEIDKCYTLDLSLALSQYYNAYSGFDKYWFSSPCIFEVIGYNGECPDTTNSEILWQSDLITNHPWQTFEINFTPENDTYTKIALRPNFGYDDYYFNSAIVVDKLEIHESDNLFIDFEGELWIPEGATDIKWYYYEELIDDKNGLKLPYIWDGYYTAIFYDEFGCLKKTSQDFFSDEVSIHYYPNPTTDLVYLEFFSGQEDLSKLRLFDTAGQLVFEGNYPMVLGKNKFQISLKKYGRGVYYLYFHRPGLNSEKIKLVYLD